MTKQAPTAPLCNETDLLGQVLEQLADPVVVIDLRQRTGPRIAAATPTAARLLGAEAVVGRALVQPPTGARDNLATLVYRYLAEGATLPWEAVLEREGEPPLPITLKPLRDGEGRLSRLLARCGDTGERPAEPRFGPQGPTFERMRQAVDLRRNTPTREAAETELRTRAESFRTLAENSPDVVIRYDRECRRIYANPAFLRLAGPVAPQEFLGKRPSENSPVVTRPPAYEAKIRQVLATGEAQNLLFHVKGARGEVWHQALFLPELDQEGQISSVLAIGHDVTALLDAQQALHRRNRELRAISRCNQSVIRAQEERALLQEVCRIICEDAGYRMAWIGYAEPESPGILQPMAWAGPESDYLIEARPPDDPCASGTSARTGQAVAVQEIETDPRMEHGRADALRRGFRSVIALPFKDERGRVFGVLTIYSAEPNAFTPDETRLLEELAEDVAFGVVALRNREQRKQAEEALLESEQKFRTIFQNAPLGLFRMSFEGRVLEANPAFAAMFGYDSAAAVRELGDVAAQIYPSPESRTTSIATLLAAPDTTRHQTRFRRKDGSEFSANLFLKTIRDGNGSPMFLEGIAEDVTGIKRSEERLRLLNFALNNVKEEAFLINEQAAFQYVNEEASRSLGYERDQLLGMTVPEIDPDFTAERWREHWNDIKTKGALTFQGYHKSRDQRLYPVEITANYFEYDGNGYNLALVRDISERRRTELAMERLNRALKTLSSGNEALVRAESEADLLQQMCRVVVEIGAHRFAWIGFAQADGAIEPRAWAGNEEGFLVARRLYGEADPVDEAVRSGEARVVHDFSALPTAFREELQRRGLRAFTAFPLSAGESTGVLAIYSAEDDAFKEDEVRLLREMSNDLAYGIRALRLRMERETYVANLRAGMESTVEALSSTVELRDPYTAGHQRRVAKLATRLARELDWPEERIQAIYLAGMVHDIGKIAVPAEILSKPGRLTEAEMMLVRSHATAGYEILKSVVFPWPIAQIVHQHHERLDGSGYPLGLKGEAISMEARILSVCDVVEAMTTHRPYRPGLGIEKALEEIERGRGSLFESAIVDACIDLFRNHGHELD